MENFRQTGFERIILWKMAISTKHQEHSMRTTLVGTRRKFLF